MAKAHGLKGAIKLELYTDTPDERFVPGATFELQVPETSPWFGKTVTLTELRWYNQAAVVFLEGISDRNAAETLIKAVLLVEQPEDQLPTEPDAWYDHQLTGLTVIRAGAESGKVVRVEHLPAQDLLVIEFEGNEVLVPFVKALVPEVDIAAGKIFIDPPLGLFEPDQAEIALPEPGSSEPV